MCIQYNLELSPYVMLFVFFAKPVLKLVIFYPRKTVSANKWLDGWGL